MSMIRIPGAKLFTENVTVAHEHGDESGFRYQLSGDQADYLGKVHALGCPARFAVTLWHVTVTFLFWWPFMFSVVFHGLSNVQLRGKIDFLYSYNKLTSDVIS